MTFSRISILATTAIVFTATAGQAECVTLDRSQTYSLTRHDPYFSVTNTVSNDGTVREIRESQMNGVTAHVETIYWNGVIAIDRQSDTSHIQVFMDSSAQSADLSRASQAYSYPMTLMVNGATVDHGTFTMETIEQTSLYIGDCAYPVMIVRTTMERQNGSPINEEALLSVEAGMLLGNVAMTADWQPRHGVFFDEIAVK
ncbi:hypothetical protein [Yoonia sp. I 8.24]|uniref:hypothetical protein n=1 Tax=Yoonia sp. I 8.24 TaxID=1537229 RepID=UPI001EE14332|nr:hypothetical protein [Yoonia sp. I 8.24]MCG3268910.1 hypothetical protein [Yoonia sp. I 8.24]